MKPNLRISIQTLLQAGKAQREISRVIGVDPRTVRRIAREAKSPGVATGFSAETERRAAVPDLQQSGPHIRDIEEYHRFFENAQRRFDDQTTENL